MDAICLRCGTLKSDFQARCPSCNFTPEDDVDIAKYRILGPLYSFALGEDGATVDTGRSRTELEAIALEIKQGRPYEFPSEELEGVLKVYRSVQSVSPRQLLLALLPLYLGGLAVIVGLVYIIWLWVR